MTPFLRKVAEFLRQHPDGVKIVRRISTEDTLDPPEEEEGVFYGAIPVPEEGRKEFEVFPVPQPEAETQFTHFIDGIQHSRLLYYQQTEQGYMPVVYGYVSAGILVRHERQLHLHEMESEEALYMPLKAFDPHLFEQAGIPVHDVLEEREISKTPFATILVRAGATVARVRDQLERRLALEWMQRHPPTSEAWLLVDGSIADLLSKLPERQFVHVVGVSKSHRSGYLPPEWMVKVMTMPAGYRSTLFRPQRQEVAEVYSWYLRLRWQEGASPTYGLVRVEMPVLTMPDEAQYWADTLSNWILQETRPLSLPDPRYDRLLYPMRMCEQHLRSRAPSEMVVRTAVERVGMSA